MYNFTECNETIKIAAIIRFVARGGRPPAYNEWKYVSVANWPFVSYITVPCTVFVIDGNGLNYSHKLSNYILHCKLAKRAYEKETSTRRVLTWPLIDNCNAIASQRKIGNLAWVMFVCFGADEVIGQKKDVKKTEFLVCSARKWEHDSYGYHLRMSVVAFPANWVFPALDTTLYYSLNRPIEKQI